MRGQDAQASPVVPSRRSRRVTILIVSVGLAGIAAFFFPKISSPRKLRLGACFQNVEGLRRGARVRLAGVDVGVVSEVRAHPTDPACPAAVEMELRRELKIPDDSVASVDTEGLLGPSFLEIDVTRATGPAIRDGGALPSKESVRFNAETLNRALTKAVERITQRIEDDKKSRDRDKDEKAPPGAPSQRPSAAPTTK